ncbi:MAG: DNA mismatch repair protein MutS [Pseudomonadota bacterium]
MARHPGATPVMAQFLDMKAAHPDSLLFFRMGDFYELFFEDAVKAAGALGIALTKRGTHQGEPIPMCGVPIHNAERYLNDLIRAGFRVALAEQVEDPAEAKKRGSKAVVAREVLRLYTPGTLVEDTLLETARHNYLAAWAPGRNGDAGGLAWTDMSTGRLSARACSREALPELLARLSPAELVLAAPADAGAEALAREVGAAVAEVAPASFQPAQGALRTAGLFGAATLAPYGDFSDAEAGALGALIGYLELTQKGDLPLLQPPRREAPDAGMAIDPATRRNLELTESLSGGRDGALLSVIDRTQTAAGARLLADRASAPVTDLEEIRARQDAVALFLEAPSLRTRVREILAGAPDLARALSRIGLGRHGPRDLKALANGLRAAEAIGTALAATGAEGLGGDPAAERLADGLSGHQELIEAYERALAEDPPFRLSDGGAIRDGCDADLDEARRLRDRARQVIAERQARHAEETGISALKIKHNNVLGYFIETPATHARKMMNPPWDERFIHRQTTANAVRFTTVELSELEAKIARAGDRAAEREKAICDALAEAARGRAREISAAAEALAAIDVAAGLAELAEREDWTRPVVEASRAFEIEAGRHPVVEAALRKAGEAPFVANDCDLSAAPEEGGPCEGDPLEGSAARPIWLITGPNMAGKSTYLRQNALIAVLAQMGSFVPAARARIGVVDRLFSRVGAADDLARGRSTFMVEMVETATILNQAGPRSLVILDEIGRGTATYDGLSIAWATLEHLHDVNRCRGLFATHYHELTALAGRLAGLKTATVAVREWKGEVVFLREIQPGAADRSYGVQVARLAGMPPAVVARARTLLDMLEQGDAGPAARAAKLVADLPLFAAASAPEPAAADPLRDALDAFDPDAMTPREALEALYALKEAAASEDERA